MGLDIRIPIGLMFVIFGAVISAYGFFTNADIELYRKSLSINVNIWMGLFMLVFGAVMLLFVKLKKSGKNKSNK